jgi:hypothetical protein
VACRCLSPILVTDRQQLRSNSHLLNTHHYQLVRVALQHSWFRFPLRRSSDGEKALFAGHPLEFVSAAVVELEQESLDWLKTNFYKTELELGHCLRLPQEGPCECDLYLTCPKFVTTPKYAPRLRERLCMEQTLAADAETRGWVREVERDERTADRIRSLLLDLGEPAEPDCP